ncbi:unnamed protein product [Parajaminaea phylloscopi]
MASPWRQQLDTWLNTSHAITSKVSVRPIDFRLEAAVALVAVAYVLLHLVGQKKNRRLADTWVAQALPAVEKEFATTAKDGEGKGELLLWNGGDEAVFYASGRRGVESMHAHFHLTPRHDPLLHVYHTLYDVALATPVSSVRDTLTLTFQLPPTTDNTSGVFAIVDKSVLQSLRTVRPFDLSFARLLDANDDREQRGLDRKWAIMSENAELTDGFLGETGSRGDERRAKIGIQRVINSDAGNYLESLILTDLPQDRPEEVAKLSSHPRLLILNLRVPTSAAAARASLPLFALCTNILDAIEFSLVSPSEKAWSKIHRNRTDFERDFEKQKEKERKEADEEERKWLGKKEQQPNNKKAGGRELTEKEAAKKKELEEKRARRKAQGKGMKVRGG